MRKILSALILTLTFVLSGSSVLGLYANAHKNQEQKPAVNLKDYTGRYEVDPNIVENFVFDVFLEQETLWIKPSHQPKTQLTSKSSDTFVVTGPGLIVKFARDDKGMVQSFSIDPTPDHPRQVSARKLVLPAPSLKGSTTLRLKGHNGARIVAVAGSFNDWNQSQVLCGQEEGDWVCRLDLAPGKYTYKFIVDGDWMLDPNNSATETDERGHENSVLEVKKS